MEAYRRAADYYTRANELLSARPMQLKVAQYSAQRKQYDVAIEVYEEIAMQSIESTEPKAEANEYWLSAGICALATGELERVRTKQQQYEAIDQAFHSSREGSFLQALVRTCEVSDSDALADATFEFDQATRLEPWKITVLLHIKERIARESA